MQKIIESLAVYWERRMARIMLLGIISGFPWVLIGSSLNLWLKEDGLSRTAIGFAGLIFGVYAINFLWAPLIDRIRIPWLTGKLGHRRAWIVTLQAVIVASLVLWSFADPTANLAWVVGIGLAIAIASATQDIAVDALRIEQMGTSEGEAMAAGAATAVVGWWTGYKLGGIIALESATAFQNAGVEDYWQATFLVLGVVVIITNIGLLFVHEQGTAERIASQAEEEGRIASSLGVSGTMGHVAAWLGGTVVSPLMSFFRRNGFAIALTVLGFIFLFKIGEAFMGRMSILFYREIGFSKSEIALYSKGLGWVTTVGFTVLGGFFAIRMGLIRAMFLSGIAMAATNLLFAVLFWVGKSEALVRHRRGGGRPHQRLRHRHLRGLHLHAGGPHLHRHPVCAAGLHRHRRTHPAGGRLRRPGGLAGRRLGRLLHHHHPHGDPVAHLPVGHPRKTPGHAGRSGGPASGAARGTGGGRNELKRCRADHAGSGRTGRRAIRRSGGNPPSGGRDISVRWGRGDASGGGGCTA